LALVNARQSHELLSLVAIDLDRFKAVNAATDISRAMRSSTDLGNSVPRRSTSRWPALEATSSRLSRQVAIRARPPSSLTASIRLSKVIPS
jgi:predicted signal transduction protein with EAL and GGDEF domain